MTRRLRTPLAMLALLIGAAVVGTEGAQAQQQPQATMTVVWPFPDDTLDQIKRAQQLADTGDSAGAAQLLEGLTTRPYPSLVAKALGDLYAKAGPMQDAAKSQRWGSVAWDLRQIEAKKAWADIKRAEQIIASGSGDYAMAAQLIEQAIKLFRQRDAVRALATLYAEGKGVPLNPIKARDLYIEAFDHRAIDYLCGGAAQYTRFPDVADPDQGLAILKSKGVQDAKSWYEASMLFPTSRRGWLEYQCYSRRPAPDEDLALKTLKTASYVNPSPYRDNSELLRWMPPITAELDAEFRLYDRHGAIVAHQGAAESGVLAAMVALYRAYNEGRGAPQDRQVAFDWALKAANLGDGYARAIVGEAYLRGYVPVAQDYSMARTWLLQAAEQRQPMAASLLAEIYGQGLGVKPDRQQAATWQRRCVELGGTTCQPPNRPSK